MCEQLAQGRYVERSGRGLEPATYWLQVRRSVIMLPSSVNPFTAAYPHAECICCARDYFGSSAPLLYTVQVNA